MDNFFRGLEDVLTKYALDVTALDDYEVETDFIKEIIGGQFEVEKTRVVAVDNVHVFDGPHVSAISASLSVRFDLTLLPDYNIEERRTLKVFIKVPPFEGQSETARKLCRKEILVYSKLFMDMKNFLDHPLKPPYLAPLPRLVFSDPDVSLLVLSNIAEEGYHSPRHRLLEGTELKSVLRALAKFHADGIKFLKDTQGYDKYDFMEKDQKRPEFVTELLEKYLEPYLNFLDQYSPVQPAVMLLREMGRKKILESVFDEMDRLPQKTFHTICHMNIWTGNLFLQEKPSNHSEHNVVLVDWTHCQIAPFTQDVVHLIFACCGSDMMTDWTEIISDYYDYLKGYLSTHALDSNNLGLNFDKFMGAVAKTVRAEFLVESVITPLTLLCGAVPKEATLSQDDLTDLFEAGDYIEEDVMPMMEMAMSLGLTKPVEQMDPEMFKEAGRRGSVLSGKLVTRKESLKAPLPACLRKKRSSLASRGATPKSPHRRPSLTVNGIDADEMSRSSSPGSGVGSGKLSRSNSRRGSACPEDDAMVALRDFQMKQSKQYRAQGPTANESLGSALRMIKKRRSLFEHASVFGYGAW